MENTVKEQSLVEAIQELDFFDILGKKQEIITGDTIAFLDVDYDNDTDSPNDCGTGEIRSFNRRHNSYISQEEVQAILDETPKRILFLDYYEHSSGRWSLAGEGYQCQWDTSNYAGVYIAPEDEEANTEEARSFCETFTDWINGEVYWFGITVYPIIKDVLGNVITDASHYRNFVEPDLEESCGGFYGIEYMKEEVLGSFL
jgi:hypothetical protein